MREEQNTSKAKPLKYNPQLDGLRFCAILFVVSYHWVPGISETAHGFFLGGLINFFFVLSGYLITRILFSAKEKGIQYNISKPKVIFGFYLRRAIRIFPAYYFILLVCVLLPTTGEEVRHNAASYFFYYSNYSMYKHQSWPPITAQFWSLAVEEQFYLAWPLLIIFVHRKYLLKTFVLFITASILMKACYFHPVFPVPLSTLTQFAMDAFAAGGILAYKYTYATISEKKFINKWMNILCYAGIPVCIVVVVTESYYLSFVLNRFLFAIFSMKIIDGAIKGYKNRLGNFLQSKIAVKIGQISYGIYLWHLLVPVLFWNLFNWIYAVLNKHHPYFFSIHQAQIIAFEKFLTSTIVCYIIYAALTIVAATISWNLIETPFSKLKSLIKISAPQATASKPLSAAKPV